MKLDSCKIPACHTKTKNGSRVACTDSKCMICKQCGFFGVYMMIDSARGFVEE